MAQNDSLALLLAVRFIMRTSCSNCVHRWTWRRARTRKRRALWHLPLTICANPCTPWDVLRNARAALARYPGKAAGPEHDERDRVPRGFVRRDVGHLPARRRCGAAAAAGISNPRCLPTPVSAIRRDAEARNLALRFRATRRIVRSDPLLLERVLANLVQNALRYTRKGGVLVAARRSPDGVALEVWDTGPGIPRIRWK